MSEYEVSGVIGKLGLEQFFTPLHLDSVNNIAPGYYAQFGPPFVTFRATETEHNPAGGHRSVATLEFFSLT